MLLLLKELHTTLPRRSKLSGTYRNAVAFELCACVLCVLCVCLRAQVYMGGELGERPKQGLVTQTVSKIVMSFAKQVGCAFSCFLLRGGVPCSNNVTASPSIRATPTWPRCCPFAKPAQ